MDQRRDVRLAVHGDEEVQDADAEDEHAEHQEGDRQRVAAPLGRAAEAQDRVDAVPVAEHKQAEGVQKHPVDALLGVRRDRVDDAKGVREGEEEAHGDQEDARQRLEGLHDGDDPEASPAEDPAGQEEVQPAVEYEDAHEAPDLEEVARPTDHRCAGDEPGRDDHRHADAVADRVAVPARPLDLAHVSVELEHLVDHVAPRQRHEQRVGLQRYPARLPLLALRELQQAEQSDDGDLAEDVDHVDPLEGPPARVADGPNREVLEGNQRARRRDGVQDLDVQDARHVEVLHLYDPRPVFSGHHDARQEVLLPLVVPVCPAAVLPVPLRLGHVGAQELQPVRHVNQVGDRVLALVLHFRIQQNQVENLHGGLRRQLHELHPVFDILLVLQDLGPGIFGRNRKSLGLCAQDHARRLLAQFCDLEEALHVPRRELLGVRV
mmetsp:Transcript_44952/g.118757  ORF Transcript_44952/g.118757 Transcript_44952/m.118757 type:complete len:435 (-) Transcript_44952:922-2226(-)